MKCIVCDSNEAVIHGQCESCFRGHVQVTTNGQIDLTICPKCNAFKLGNTWSRGDMEKPLVKKINSKLSTNDPNVSARVMGKDVELRRLENRITFNVEIESEGLKIKGDQHEIPAKILLNSCLTCNKITGSYYESIIQLRTLTAEYTPIIDSVLKDISGMLENMHNSKNDSFVSKIEPVQGGVDVYLGKKNDGIKVSKYIHDHFLSDTTRTKKQAGRREGEDFFRHTFLVRLFNLKPGTVIWSRERPYILEKVSSNAITVVDPRTERRHDILQNDFNSGSYTFSEENVETKELMVVSTQNNETMAMDKQNFEVSTLKGEYEGEITVFDYKGKYIVTSP